MTFVVQGSELSAFRDLFYRCGKGIPMEAEELVELGPCFSVFSFRIIAVHAMSGDDLVRWAFEPLGQLQQLLASVQRIAGHGRVETGHQG